jgi:cell division transport system ATP-binding protein
MITCQNIRQIYPRTNISKVEVLQNISFALKPGGFYFLTGASGAGKTTLLKILSLNMQPTSGKLFMFGQDVLTLNRNVLPLLRRRIGCVYQNYRLLDHLSIAQNIALPQKVMGVPESEYKDKVEELLMWIQLDHVKGANPHILSGGEKQRVAIARAVVNNPAIIIADEPTGNLDPELSKKVMRLFEALNGQGATVLIATHDTRLLEEFKYPILRLKDGVIEETEVKK